MAALPKTQNRLLTSRLKHSDPSELAPLSYGQETSKGCLSLAFSNRCESGEVLTFLASLQFNER